MLGLSKTHLQNKLFLGDRPEMRVARLESMPVCELCGDPTCMKPEALDVRRIMKSVCGEFAGAKKSAQSLALSSLISAEEMRKEMHSRTLKSGRPVAISKVLKFVRAPL